MTRLRDLTFHALFVVWLAFWAVGGALTCDLAFKVARGERPGLRVPPNCMIDGCTCGCKSGKLCRCAAAAPDRE